MNRDRSSFQIHVHGMVQGVGFRPFVYRLARELNLDGSVENRNDGVWINLFCTREGLDIFISLLKRQAPPPSTILSVEVIHQAMNNAQSGFRILASQNGSDEITGICPDIAVCEKCLEDMKNHPRRISYPFVNCTHCGPRFSIIRELPWDRPNTSMSGFSMCDGCRAEYTDMLDRRFHAQPIACTICGPVYYQKGFQPGAELWADMVGQIIQALLTGRIGAIQGIGGYHLVCDATNALAVAELRKRKHRDGKPFAVMFMGIEEIRQYCECSEAEEKLITSWQRPIVILKEHKCLNSLVNKGLGSLGVMLPYTPLQHQLMTEGKFQALICTSGNLSDEPIVITPEAAEDKLKDIADFFIHSNRPIINRTDDSVARLAGENTILIRRSRSYVPTAIQISLSVDGILALGAEQKNTFCLGKNREAILSQHIGDLKNFDTFQFMEESLARFKKIYRFNPTLIVTDQHPDYLSTQFGNSLGIPVIAVQHHHAHIASCMAEHQLDEPVIGVAFDGTGLGTDQTIWGGEFLIATLDQFTRFTWLDPVKVPGGDQAVREPWRVAIAYLYKCYGENIPFESFTGLQGIPEIQRNQIISLLKSDVPVPVSSAAGRLFDAISTLTGCCIENTFDAEAPIRLEMVANQLETGEYPFQHDHTISFTSTIEAIRVDLENHVPVSVISARFHRTLARAILETCLQARELTRLKSVVLSGGTFQNAFLTRITCSALLKNKFNVYTHRVVPPNDGGISLGQLVVAAKKQIKKNVSKHPGRSSIHQQ
ncbi:MAG: carbamoyltransferase HypF [Bacteroidales bacterium]